MYIMQTLPTALRNWDNWIETLTASEILLHEIEWQRTLLDMYVSGKITKAEADEAWGTWETMKKQCLDEMEA
jgi:hypothetical protein